MRVCALISLSVCLQSTASWAAEIWISGGWTCADWAGLRTKGTALHLENYVVGLLDGLAMASGRDIWQTPYKIEPEQAYHWMDQYCAAEPLGFIASGAFALATERLGAGWSIPQGE